MKSAILKMFVVIILSASMVGGTKASMQRSAPKIDINAKRFGYQPSEVTLRKGQPVTLVFHSQDVNHGFESEDFHVKADIPKRGTAEVTFVPDQVGDFTGKCAHFCGAGHGQMQLTIHVTQ